MTATFYVGDAIEVMNKLPEKSVDLILTSPPFLALRSYLPSDHPSKALEGGSQATPGEFIDWLIDVVEACDRVLAKHGSMCIELGDTYAGSGGAGGDYNENGLREGQPKFRATKASPDRPHLFGRGAGNRDMGDGEVLVVGGTGWPLAKSLSLIPELFRFTLVYGFNPLTGRQTERWRLRNVVRWVRPNPPVGALGDKFRPATSELMVFCKSAKRYFDLDAVRDASEDVKVTSRDGHPKQEAMKAEGVVTHGVSIGLVGRTYNKDGGAPPLDWWRIAQSSNLRQPCVHNRYEEHWTYHCPHPYGNHDTVRDFHDCQENNKTLCPGGDFIEVDGSPLDWWNIPPGGYEGAHYAVFPPELCVKPVKAMCPEKVCRVCGEPSRRIVGKSERYEAFRASMSVVAPSEWTAAAGNRAQGLPSQVGRSKLIDGSEFTGAEYDTLGFSDCGHDDWRPGLVLDCFAGSGTTLMVATGHGRDAIGIDLDERNYDLALQRVGPFILSRAESV